MTKSIEILRNTDETLEWR